MVASGLLALLTLQFVKHFLSSSTILDNYYKAYYMARGGLETLLTEANVRGYGYQQDLSKSSIETNYYANCAGKSLCQLQGRIISHGAGISDSPASLSSSSCESADMIVLTPGESSAYPLFYDRGNGDNISFAPVQTSDYEKL